MKILFVIRAAAHFSYHESTIRRLCANGHTVRVLYDLAHSDLNGDDAAQSCAAETPGLALGLSLRRSGLIRRLLFASREILSYGSYLAREEQVEFYRKRWLRYLPTLPRELFSRSGAARKVVASAWGQSVLRAFERLSPADRAIVASLRTDGPDVVVASPTNMRYSEETEYVKAAKALGIPTVVPVLSWDNLTTKGLIQVWPDALLVWNETQREEAVAIHGIPREATVVTGSPFMDKWFERPGPPLGGQKFREAVGLAPGQRYVLYLGSSANIARDESWLVARIAEGLAKSDDSRLREMAVLARPHGANQEVFRGLSAPNLRVWLRHEQLPDSQRSFAEYEASLRHSVCAVGLNTTAMVDALLADRPVIAMTVKEYAETNASQAAHFRYLLDADVYEQAPTPDACAELVRRSLDGEDAKRASRKRFALDFVRPHGLETPAGENAARAMEMAAQGVPAASIDEALATAAREGATVAPASAAEGRGHGVGTAAS